MPRGIKLHPKLNEQQKSELLAKYFDPNRGYYQNSSSALAKRYKVTSGYVRKLAWQYRKKNMKDFF